MHSCGGRCPAIRRAPPASWPSCSPDSAAYSSSSPRFRRTLPLPGIIRAAALRGALPAARTPIGSPVIPWFVLPPLRLGPLAVQPFGVLSAAGVLLASTLLVREARRRGLDPGPLEKLVSWAVIGGIVGAHLVHLLLY